jgi:hypothetical protein
MHKGEAVTDPNCPKCLDMCDHLAAEHALRVQIERERLETSRQVTALQAEVRELYGRLAEVRELQRSLETLIVAGVAALEAIDRLGVKAPETTPATTASPPLLSWLRGVLAPRDPAPPPTPRPPRDPRY